MQIFFAYQARNTIKCLVLFRLGVQYLLQGKNAAARVQFEHVLSVDTTDGVAAAHLGFILKTAAEKGGADLEIGVALLAQGVDSQQEGTQEGNFYYQVT
jgi:Tfp pilus assembly protein PilF